ncbi:hypothetical protein [Pelagicoccus mobilis]|uniref:Uncharacterized protein n=1 Tax=Pelagicoccus mobilis TaxID=415221 RepID=A0A934RXJ5_9BACT|nr:hypothetical protein [Pelagicoccus mobilis]MBK1876646.1 hypothetical protein [Pelagicoccus mobilis]
MNRLKRSHRQTSLRLTKICLSCFGIAGTTFLASGALKLSVLNNDRKIDHAFRFLTPINETLQQIVEQALY